MFFTAALLVGLTACMANLQAPIENATEDFGILNEIYDELENNFVEPEKLSPFSLANGAIEGISQLLEENAQKDLLQSEFTNCTSIVTIEPDESEPIVDCLAVAYNAILSQTGVTEALRPQNVSIVAAQSMVASLDDRFTSYATPEQFQIRQSSSQGEFEGIGAHVQSDEDTGYFIVYPIDNSPAQHAGLIDGDRVVAVDTEDVNGLSIEEFVVKVRGPRGEPVILTIERGENSGTLDITVVRETITVPAIEFQVIPDTLQGYVRINSFSANAPQELEEALESLSDNGVKGIVIDLRFNPGGLLMATVNSAELFLDNDSKILSSVDGMGDTQNFSTSRSGNFQSIPLVILVNSFSASGSEVFSGALQDYNRAVIVGQSTFGKGSVTSVIALDDGSGLYVTSARWYTPNGRLIDELGIEPDIVVEQPLEIDLMSIDDMQFSSALEVLNGISG